MTIQSKKSLSFIKLENFSGNDAILATVDIRTNGTVTGFDKAIQDFLIELLTLKGSLKFDPEFGSPFLLFFRNHAGDIHDLASGFAIASTTIINNNATKRRHTTNKAELIAASRLVNLAVKDGKLALIVEFINGENEKRTIAFLI